MGICKRVIARLDIKGSRLIKGVRFEGVRVIGNAYDIAKKYADLGVDEIFYSDAVASLYGRNSLYELLKESCKEVFVPITAGGAINNIEDGRRLLASGADKLAINTGAIRNPNLINELANAFGSQCVVVSIQARKSLKSNNWELMIENGRENCKKDLLNWIEEIQTRGAGEIIITSVDKDGLANGTDQLLLEKILKITNIPLVIGGGIGSKNEITQIFTKYKSLSGISIGWSFHKGQLSIKKAHEAIKEAGLLTRDYSNSKLKPYSYNPKVIIVDYEMGNLESLANALRKIGINALITSERQKIIEADLVILPGVGSFPEGMKNLKSRDLIKPIMERSKKNKAILGICLGMQLLFQEGEEYKNCKGLGIFNGKIKKLPTHTIAKEKLILPHVGWNKIIFIKGKEENKLQIFDNHYQYFVHSYAYQPQDNNDSNALFISSYGGKNFVSGVKKGNCIGLQFHPERSGNLGISLLFELIKLLVRN